MECSKVVLLIIAVAAISATSALSFLSPPNKELIYDWQALVKAGTHLPSNYASQFSLNGKIHLQTNGPNTFVKIANLTYKLYNGKLDHIQEYQAQDLPVQISELESVFKVLHDENGLVVKVGLNKNDQQFSWNIKRAIAGILQVNKSVMEPITYPKSFVQKELSVYGKFDVDYTVTHDEDETIRVSKFHNMRTPAHLYENTFFNVQPEQCSLNYQPFQHGSTQNYLITKKDTQYLLEEIRSHGFLKYEPFQSNSEYQFVFVNQTMELVEMVQIQKPMEVIDEAVEDTLKYNPFVASKDGSLNDVTNGAYKFDYEKAWPKLKEMLTKMAQYMDEDHLNINEPESTKGHIVNEIQPMLQLFSLKNLEEFHTKLEGPSMKMFHHILPLVGTKASLMFIKKLLTDKTLPDDMLIESLRYFPEQVVSPTLDVLEDLEVLMHLTEDYSWEVRKVALLSFATLIHKHVMFMEKNAIKNVDPYRFQKPVEKYVLEYVDKFKQASDYKVQMVYGMALSNMRLHSIRKHLESAVHGQWKVSERLRPFIIRAVALSALTDINKDAPYEVLWPILSNRNETSIIRITSFYLLVTYNMPVSRLYYLYDLLVNEQDQELYSYAYSYLSEMTKTFKPCHQDFQIQIKNFLQMLPPPTHGRSSVQIINFQDKTYNFGNELTHHLAITNDTLLSALEMDTQRLNVRFRESIFLIKIHGIKFRGDFMDVLSDILKSKRSSRIVLKDLHIECHVFRHDYTINTHFFDEHNLGDLNKLLDFFTKDQHSVTEELTRITYNQHLQVLMPNDLGFPLVWSYVQPMAQRIRFDLKKELVNKIMTLKLDMKLATSVQWQHGLAFYNPVAHLWQGIHRYQSYDAMLPINLELTLNMQQQSLQISWRKRDRLEDNAIGFKSHVQQMVFAVEDNDLMESRRNSKQMVAVRESNEFTHNTVLYDKEILNTGHQWYAAIYDTTSYTDKNTLQKFIMAAPLQTSQSDTLFGRWIASWMYFHQYSVQLPRIGAHGFIMKILPLTKVTDLNLYVRLHSDQIIEDSFFYSPKWKLSNRITYSVKNQETTLKTWDINTILDLNAGHTINNLKMFVTRLVPGQNDYKICVDGTKKYGDNGVSGHLNIAMSQSANGKCIKDDTVIDITMVGKKSNEQLDGHQKYSSCDKISLYNLPHKHSLQCLVDHTTLRHYVVNIKTSKMPVEFKKTVGYLWDMFKGRYASHYQYQDEHNESVSEEMIKIDMEFPMGQELIDVNVTMPNIMYQLNAVPTQYYRMVGIYPDSMEYSERFQFLHQIGWVDHCVVNKNHYRKNGKTDYKMVPIEWTLYVGNKLENPDKAVYVKRMPNDELAVKIVDAGHTIEIEPVGTTNKIMLDGTVLTMDKYHHEDWVYLHIFKQDLNQPVAVLMEHSGLHVEYHRYQVVVVVPKLEQQIYGKCYQNNM